MGRTFLPPGFRFHPTDVEIIVYYLKRKIMGKKLHFFEAISEINIYRFSPWDLPDKSSLKSKDLEWYFFCPRERKYNSGGRMNRATETGYWKTTGRDRPVVYNERTVGMVKTLVFHEGHAPKGKRTDWVIHEYRIEDEETLQDSYVLCKVFKKSGPGPKNGAQYGAPFNEEDWEDCENCDIPFAIPMHPSNQNCSSVTGMIDPECSSRQPSSEPGSSAIPPAKLPDPINQNCTYVADMIDPGCSSRQPSNEPGPSLSRLHADEVRPNNQNCSVFTGTIDPGNTCSRSLANPGPSLAVPHSSEVPPDDDDISQFFASFLEDTDLLPIENNENVNCCNQGLNVDMMPCMDGNDVYTAFGGRDNFADLSGGRSYPSGSLVGDHPPNLLFPQDDAPFLELNDLVIPVDHCTRTSEADPLVEENLYSSNASFLRMEHFNYGGNFSGGNQFIPTQSQLQVLPQHYTQQVTGIGFNASQGYNTMPVTGMEFNASQGYNAMQVSGIEFNASQGYNAMFDYGFDTMMHEHGMITSPAADRDQHRG
ncbi:PREDICTED: NAC domain-containing protein 82-like isoform X2 [Ipomoea nil]|uniref:NAC domain-containing protein 82-like isoform X2 n=1 Tax=Ipomoea nil TaxID=35883 RepID=UPI0009015897|nr:PREDICTED: NAC domain-containing protein 82-like isoform X2 [Ipomoea nil]